jgi:hypothetical protein
MALLGVVVSCQRMPLDTSKEFIRDYRGLDDLHLYTVPTGDQIVFTFLDGNSFSSEVGVKTNILQKGARQRLEISFTARVGCAPSSKFMQIDRSAFATVINLQHFDPQKWEVVYKDERGIHPINYCGILLEPLKEYVPKPSEGPVTNL